MPQIHDHRRFAVVSRRIVTPTGVRDGAVLIAQGRIEKIVERQAVDKHVTVYDAGELWVLPGLVDTHVHINEPGRTNWEGFSSATRAAAAGGVTTLVDMPLNCIPVTTNVAALEQKLAALRGQLQVDCGFYGGFIPGNEQHLLPLARRGVLGFKAFLAPSGIDDFPAVCSLDLDLGLPIIAASRVPLLVHAEIEQPVQGSKQSPDGRESYASYLATRPKQWETAAVRLLIEKSRRWGGHIHVVHLSAADAVPLICDARHQGVSISAETCPHYLCFAAEDIADGDTRFKCAPPIRDRPNQTDLWKALQNQQISMVVSDHSPCTPQLKQLERGLFSQAWGGITGLQFGLSAVWTGARSRGMDLVQVAQWMATQPAALVGLTGRKGALVAGCDADLVIFDPDMSHIADGATSYHRHKETPCDKRQFLGQVLATFVRGNLVYERGEFLNVGQGQPILRDSQGV